MSANGVPPQGEKEPNVEPRETARQIAERVHLLLSAIDCYTSAVVMYGTGATLAQRSVMVNALKSVLTEAINDHVASLTADLAQARQERDTLKDERDEARLIVALINNEVIGSAGYFTSPSCVEAVQNLKLDANIARREKAAAEQARDEALKEIPATEADDWDIGGRIIKKHPDGSWTIDARDGNRRRVQFLCFDCGRRAEGKPPESAARTALLEAAEAAASSGSMGIPSWGAVALWLTARAERQP